MRKLFAIGFLVMTGFCYCWGFDWDSAEFYVSINLEDSIIASKRELIQLKEDLDQFQVIGRVPRPKMLLDELGFVTLKLPKVEMTVIDLNGYLIQQLNSIIGSIYAPTNGINKGMTIKASSFLKESLKSGTVEYRPENLLSRLAREKEVGVFLYGKTVPWVPDSKKDTSPKLSVISKEPIKAFLILNGYVDVTRKHLFKENSRVKVIEIFDHDSKKTIDRFVLLDSPNYQKVTLSKPLTTFDIAILDSYVGSKYDDICITSIIFDEFYCEVPGDYGKNNLEYFRNEIGF